MKVDIDMSRILDVVLVTRELRCIYPQKKLKSRFKNQLHMETQLGLILQPSFSRLVPASILGFEAV